MNQDFDIAICGAGVTGLLLANLLKDSPYRVALLDAGRPPVVTEGQETQSQAALDSSFDSGFQPRVSALNANSVSLLRQCSVFEKLFRFASFHEMQIKDSEGTGEIHFTTKDLGDVPELGVVVENHLVIGGLYQELLSAENISLLFEHQLEDLDSDQGRTELAFKDQPSVSCELLIAADGGNSKIRELRGRKTFGWNYDQAAIVTTLWCEKPHGNIPRQWFTQAGPLAFLPLAEPNLVSVVWSHSDADSILALPPEAFCRQLAQASEMDLGSIVATDKRFSFPLRQHHAVRYSEPGIVLIGDAAHTIHPLAGQGANLGLADAAALAQEIRQAVFSETGLSDPELLRRFVQRRQPHNLAMAAAMEAIKQLYGRRNPVLSVLRNRVMSFLDQNSLLKSAMIRVATDSAI